mgnify:CR=1 FL=1
MKIFRKTYGVRNLVEWQAVIPAGRGKLIVHFTGGSITAYGVTPATYRTDNPAQQAIIETSNHFRTGRIFLVKAELLKEVNTPAAAPAAAPAPVVEPATVEPVAAAAPEETGQTAAPEEESAGTADEDETTESGNRMEFACLEDAKQYLMDKYGYTPGAVRYKGNVKQKAAANGLVFVIAGVEL